MRKNSTILGMSWGNRYSCDFAALHDQLRAITWKQAQMEWG
jgi:hypothetical protein